MPWTELKTRRWPAFDKELDGISKETMEARKGADAARQEEKVPVG
jgi:hypothetical protein